MTETPSYDSTRLDRIEAVLDQLTGVVVSNRQDIGLLSERIGSLAESVSELRQSTSDLRKSVSEQRESIGALRESDSEQRESINALRLSTGELRQSAADFWEGLSRMQASVINLNITLRDSIQQAEVDRAEIRRIWEYLLQERPNGRGSE